MQKIIYGHKYVQGADITDIAKEVRKDIRHAVDAGHLPDTKYSVRIERYSGGRALRISAVHPDFGLLGSPARRRYTTFVQKLTDEYNFDGSDVQADYFHVNFHTTITLMRREPEKLWRPVKNEA